MFPLFIAPNSHCVCVFHTERKVHFRGMGVLAHFCLGMLRIGQQETQRLRSGLVLDMIGKIVITTTAAMAFFNCRDS